LLTRRLSWLGLGAVTLIVLGALTIDLALAASPPAPTITLSFSVGRPGTALTITGSGWPASQLVVLYVDLPAPYLGLPVRADSGGTFRLDTKWPDKHYDTSGRVNPTTPGAHKLCGDTIYPGSTATASARACTSFQVVASASPSPAQAVRTSGATIPELLVALAVLLLVIGGTVAWMRRSP
jgi:hypothetical protein